MDIYLLLPTNIGVGTLPHTNAVILPYCSTNTDPKQNHASSLRHLRVTSAVKDRFSDTRLIRTFHYYSLITDTLGKESPYIFLNSTCLLRTPLSMAPSVSVLTGFD